MKLTTVGELQEKFKAGLFIVGEDEDGELEWLATTKPTAGERLAEELQKLNKQNV